MSDLHCRVPVAAAAAFRLFAEMPARSTGHTKTMLRSSGRRKPHRSDVKASMLTSGLDAQARMRTE